MKLWDDFLYHISASQILELPVDDLIHGVRYKTCMGSSSSQLKTIATRGTEIIYKQYRSDAIFPWLHPLLQELQEEWA